ncbi:oxidoreductase family protein [Candidatus Leptofilum sp.]|uniref:oxidoreductase family protein n=1 Tax=Candidatus Leptofilum sp. TaxID=3241576 RepID=UPI003B5C9A4F
MSKMIEIPTTAEEITAVWLTEALRSTEVIGGETAVASLIVEPMNGAGVIGQMARLRPTYDSPASNLPTTLIAKYSHADPNHRANMGHVYAREITVYQNLRQQMTLTMPHYFYGDVNLETGDSILLLSDLGHLRQESMRHGCTVADAETVITHLAHHHATWWESPQLEGMDYLVRILTTFTEDQIAHYQASWEQSQEKITAAQPDIYMPKYYLEVGRRFANQRAKIAKQMVDTPMTLVHNDCHLDNLMFAAENADPPLTVIDWQSCGIGPGAEDVTRFMIFGLTIKQRRQVEEELLQTYHTHLVEQGVRNYSFEQCWRDYRLSFYKNLRIGTIVSAHFDMTTTYMQEVLAVTLGRLMCFAEDHCVDEFLA